MPSLEALGQFKYSFHNIANEMADVESLGLPFEGLKLPEKDAPEFNFERSMASLGPGATAEKTADTDSDAPADAGPDNFDIGSFVNDLPGDAAPPPLEHPGGDALSSFDDFLSGIGSPPLDPPPDTDDFLASLGIGQDEPASAMPEPEPPPPQSKPQTQPRAEQPAADDFSTPDDLLAGFSDEMEKAPSDFPAEEIPTDDFDTSDFDPGSLDAGSLDAGSLDAGNLSVQAPDAGGAEAGESAADDFNINDFDLDDTGGEQTESLSDDDFGIDLGGESGGIDLGGEPADDDFGGIDLGGEPADSDLGGIDLGGEPAVSDFSMPDTGDIADDLITDPLAADDSGVMEADAMSDDTMSFDTTSFDEALDDAASPDVTSPDETLPDAGIADFNLDDLGLDTTPDMTDTPGTSDAPEEDTSGIDLGGEPADADFDINEFDTSDFGGVFDENNAGGDSGTGDLPDDDAGDLADFGGFDDASMTGGDSAPGDDLGDLPDFGSGSDLDSTMPDFSTDAGDDFSIDSSLPDITTAPGAEMDFSQSGDSDDFGTSDTGGTSGDLPDMGDFHSDFTSESIDLDSEPADLGGEPDTGGGSFGGDVFGGDDFALAGLDDILNKSKAVSVPIITPKKGLFKRKKDKGAEEQAADDDVEEISLDQEDVDRLLRTLMSYPLNLRVACEELIAEQVILPAQLTKLIRLLVNGAHVRDTAAHVESITGKQIVIPKSFEKGTGAAFEAEQSSFAYIFVHNFLPVFRLIALILALLGSIVYLAYNFIYIPVTAESLYKRGYERIPQGEYQRANELFQRAFNMHRKKKWFYLYAEAFRDQRRYMLAEGKYDELLRFYPRDKKGVLDYANLNTNFIMNFEKANRLLQRELLDFAPNDREGLLAAGDNFLAWADSNPSRFFERYEDARFSYARLLELYGWQPMYVERMMKYFIRIDDLREVLDLRRWFEAHPSKRPLSAESLSELGGYLLDKQLERPSGVPNAYVESIESVRDMLLRAVIMDPNLPEPHYHLARYHNNLGNTREERLTLENAIRAFDLARQESIRRRLNRVDAHFRYANLLINNREFFPADEQAVRGIELFEDYMNRNLIPPTPQLGKLYSLRGDLEYFVKTGNMQAALTNYHAAERYGYSPPEVQYRMGAAYYQQEEWRNALDYLFRASADLPLNRRLLFAMGNAAFQRGDHFAAQGYYNRLLDVLESQRVRLHVLLPNDGVQFLETGERLMMARNNAGVAYEMLAEQTGRRDYRSRAMVMYAESARAWDAITRNPETMTRMSLTETPGAPSINLGYLNANNALRPNSNLTPQIFVRIDRDVLEPSKWEELTGY